MYDAKCCLQSTVLHYSRLMVSGQNGLGWLVGFGFNGHLRQYFSLYWAVSQREGERRKKGQMRVKMSKQPPPAPTASAVGPCPTVIQIVGRPGTGSLPRTKAPPDHPLRTAYNTFMHFIFTFTLVIQRTLVITTVFVIKDFAVKSNLLL